MASINAGGTILAGTIHLQADYVHCNATINGKPMRPGLIQEDQLYVIPSDPDIASLQTSGITRYGYTAHNCSCNNDKTGIILRPVDPKFKVLILERCLYEQIHRLDAGSVTMYEQNTSIGCWNCSSAGGRQYI